MEERCIPAARPVLKASKQVLDRLQENVSSFWCSEGKRITVLEMPPGSLQFLRDFVAPSRPCIIRNAILNQQSFSPITTTLDELAEAFPDLLLQVDVTPDGHGDCLRKVRRRDEVGIQNVLVQPLQQTMSMSEFRMRLRQNQTNLLSSQATLDDERTQEQAIMDRIFDTQQSPSGLASSMPSPPGVVYYSRQNDCLRTELTPLLNHASLLNDIPKTIDFAEEAFGNGPPDAVNLWIGNECSVSSFHKDCYENLIYVLSGTKVFYLCPPADAVVLKQKEYLSASFVCHDDGTWKVQMDDDVNASNDDNSQTTMPQKARWIGADPTRQDHMDANPFLSQCHVIEVHVHAGEMLYLPSLWFHKVTQTCETIAVNYWYDMTFDAKWCYFEFLEGLQVVGPNGESDESDDFDVSLS
jgi:jumonji domain-containing protein 7